MMLMLMLAERKPGFAMPEWPLLLTLSFLVVKWACSITDVDMQVQCMGLKVGTAKRLMKYSIMR